MLPRVGEGLDANRFDHHRMGAAPQYLLYERDVDALEAADGGDGQVRLEDGDDGDRVAQPKSEAQTIDALAEARVALAGIDAEEDDVAERARTNERYRLLDVHRLVHAQRQTACGRSFCSRARALTFASSPMLSLMTRRWRGIARGNMPLSRMAANIAGATSGRGRSTEHLCAGHDRVLNG